MRRPARDAGPVRWGSHHLPCRVKFIWVLHPHPEDVLPPYQETCTRTYGRATGRLRRLHTKSLATSCWIPECVTNDSAGKSPEFLLTAMILKVTNKVKEHILDQMPTPMPSPLAPLRDADSITATPAGSPAVPQGAEDRASAWVHTLPWSEQHTLPNLGNSWAVNTYLLSWMWIISF